MKPRLDRGTESAGGPSGDGLSPSVLARIRHLVSLYPRPRSALLPACHVAQAEHGYLSPAALSEVAEVIGIEPAELLGTVSFYEMFHTEPVGRYLIGICTNIACLLDGAEELLEHAARSLGVAPGGTTDDGLFSLEEVECIAACDKAPCLAVNWRVFPKVDAAGFDKLVEDLREGRLDGDVPRHGTLSRIERRRGLEAPLEEIDAQRAEADRAAAERARVAAEAKVAKP